MEEFFIWYSLEREKKEEIIIPKFQKIQHYEGQQKGSLDERRKFINKIEIK